MSPKNRIATINMT